jgi:DNA polymerase-3 subunit gamma/tau
VEHQALYRKYRPQTFGEVVGQDHVTSTLEREVSEEKVAHAYLFAGPRGTGKTTTARILAKALNCPNQTAEGEPCDDCDSCNSITAGSSFDVIEMDAASNNSVEDIRDLNVSVTTVASVGGGRRVFILDEAHMLSKAASNALLKTLEDPPSHVHFVLATTEPYKLLDTIRSRTQRFDFHPVPIGTLVEHLQGISDAEGYESDEAGLTAVARHAGGSVRDSLSLLEQVAALGAGTVNTNGVREALGLASEEMFPLIANAVRDQNAGAVLKIVADLDRDGVDLRRFLSEAIAFFRGVFLATYTQNLEEIVDETASVISVWRQVSAEIPAPVVLRVIDLLTDGLVKIREGREERLMVELTLLKAVRPELSDDSASLRDRISRVEKSVSAGTQPAAPVAQASARTLPPAKAQEPAKLVTERPDEQEEPEAAPTTGATAPEPPSESSAPKLQSVPDPAPMDPALPVPPASIGLSDLERIWPQLFSVVNEELGPRRQALFREASPGSVENGVVRLFVPGHQTFHINQLQADTTVKNLIKQALSRLLGANFEVEFGAHASAPALEVVEDADPFDELIDDEAAPPVSHEDMLATELGAVFVEEISREDD